MVINIHKRTRTGWMRRTSRIYLQNTVNSSKLNKLNSFLNNYKQAMQYVIVRFWSTKDFSKAIPYGDETKQTRERFGFTARLANCAVKQAKECVNSQEQKKERIPRIHKSLANLDSRFVVIEPFDGSFDMCLKFRSGVPKIVVPFNWNKHTDKFRNNGWMLGRSIRLGSNTNGGVFIDLLWEKPRPPKITEGKIVGVDRGFRSMLYTASGQEKQEIGAELADKIKKAGKRRKSFHHYIETEENRLLKTLIFTNVKAFSMERLKNVKRGKFSRQSNRLLSFWHYAKVGTRLAQHCDEAGISIYFKDPWKTSQRCPECGNIDRRNRNGKKFLCLKCGCADDADHIGAKNLEQLGLAGTNSLRLLKSGSAI
jgi:IS605 OrfB family transposase